MNGARIASAPPSIARWWATKSRGEQRVVAVLAIVVALVVGWWALWQPLVNDLASMRAEAPRSRAALAEAHRMADEIAELSKTPLAARSGDARQELDGALAGTNLRAAVTQLDWQDGRARVVFAAVDFAKLVAALETLQRDTGLAVVDGTITARVEPGTVRAELTLAR